MADLQALNTVHGRAVLLPERSAPSTPSSGLTVVYANSVGHLCYKDDAGVEHVVPGLVGGGAHIHVASSAPTSPVQDGDFVVRTDTLIGMSSLEMWADPAVAASANRGLDLASALTELDTATTTGRSSRRIVSGEDIGSQVQIAVSMLVIGTTNVSVVVSIRDTSNTANVLATATQASGTTTNTMFNFKSTWAAKPAWLTGDKTLAVHTSGGNGAMDFVFKSVELRWKP